MNKNTSVSIILTLLFAIPVTAQYNNFDISQYRLPDIKTSSLDLQFNLNNSYQDLNRKGEINTDFNSRIFGGGLNASLYHFRNSEKYQGSQTLSVAYSPYYYKIVDDDQTEKNNHHQAAINFQSINRFYNSSLYFIELSPFLEYTPYTSNSTEDDVTEKSIHHYFIFSAPVSAGWGRREPVQDARLAVYILDELTKLGKIINQPDEAEILELAAGISRIKKKRFFDSRIRKIEELQAIDSFLVAGNIVSSGDIAYFTCLNDQWDYASGPERYSGISANFGFNNKINIAVDWWETAAGGGEPVSNTTRMNEFTLGGFVQLRYSKPLNLRLQSDLAIKLPYDYLITRDPSNDEINDVNDYNTHRLQPTFDYSIRWLPDSRTSAGLSTGSYYRYLSGERKMYDSNLGIYTDNDVSARDFSWYVSLDMYYYISPRIRFLADWSMSVRNIITTIKQPSAAETTNKLTDFNHYLTVRLIYSLF